MPNRTHYLPIEDIREGMVLAETVRDPYQMPLLPAGSSLSAENIRQLLAHAVEFICVSYPDPRSAEEIGAQSATAAHAVMEIFASADLSDPVLFALFNQVLVYRSA